MQHYTNISYNNRIGVIDPVSVSIELATIALPFVLNSFQHPAADARGVISSVKNKVQNLDSANRVAEILKATTQISPKAKDVEANELMLWYRMAYPNDYTTLTSQQKMYWNQYIDFAIQTYNENQSRFDYQQSKFSDAEINYGQTTGLLNSTTGKYLVYGAIGLGLLLMIKK